MGKNRIPGRSPDANGDQEYGRERCRVLDIAARIVFGVSVMDRQIEEYLADMDGESSTAERREERMRGVRNLSLKLRFERIGEHIEKDEAKALQERVGRIKEVRNVLTHSTLDVDAYGSVKLAPGLKEYHVDSLAATLRKTEACNAHIHEIFEMSLLGEYGGGEQS